MYVWVYDDILTVSTYCTVFIMDILWILAVVSHWFTVHQMDVFNRVYIYLCAVL